MPRSEPRGRTKELRTINMLTLIRSQKTCATICTVLAFALLLGVSYAFNPVSHGPNPIPPDDEGGNAFAHGPNPIPPDDEGGNAFAHGPNPIPPDDEGGNDFFLV
jgi:hypothetical protein